MNSFSKITCVLLFLGASGGILFAQGPCGGKPCAGETPNKPASPKSPPRDSKITKPPPAKPRIPTLAGLLVNSNLPNVTVTLNGRAAGVTDSNGYLRIGMLKPGVYAVSVVKAGYHPNQAVIELSEGQTDALEFTLKPNTQTVTVASIPAECEIYVDEVLRGSTDASGNARVADVPVGEHQVTIRKSRYREAAFPLSLSSEKEGQITANLELAIGFLTVATNTPNASIEISGVGGAGGPGSKIECQPGTHTVTISSPFYVTARKEVSVIAGQEAQLSFDLEADTGARSSVMSEALEAYSRQQYDRAITLASTLLSADPKHTQALTVLAETYFMKDDFNSFTEFGSRAIEAGGSLEIRLRHKHGFGATVMHSVRLVLTAQTVSFDPQPGPGVWCSNKPFTVSLKMLGAADVGGNHENDITLRLVFADPNKPKKTTTLSFADRESYLVEESKTTGGGFIRYQGVTMVSRQQANWAMTALAELFNRARAGNEGR